MPKTKDQCLRIKEERKNEILRVSLYQFAFKGYKAVKVDDITSTAKISHGLFYHYFNDIEDIFHSLMDDKVVPYIHEVLKQIDEEKPAIESLDSLFKIVIDGIQNKNTDIACMYFLLLNLHLQKDDIPKPKKVDIANQHKDKRIYSIVKRLIEKGQKEKTIIDEDSSKLTVAILSMIAGLAFNRINLGYTKFICPKGETITEMIKIKGGSYVKEN